MNNPIPAAGVAGAEQIKLREASSTEFRQVSQLVSAAVAAFWKARLGLQSTAYCNAYVESIFPDRVVVNQDGRYWQHAYTIDAANNVVLTDPIEVVEQYVPVAMREATQTFIEAADEAGTVWDVVIIRAGASLNGNFYPDAVLREAAPLFEGVRVFAKADAEHVQGEGKSIHKLVGWIKQAKFVEGAGPDSGRIIGQLNISAAEERLRKFLVDAHKRGMKDIAGLSIDAQGKAVSVMREGRKVRQAKSITKVLSVDVIVEPSAGGEFIRLVEAAPVQSHRTESHEESPEMKFREAMLEEIKAKLPKKFAALDQENATEEQVLALYREAISLKSEADPAAGGTAPAAGGAVTAEDLRMVEARISGRNKIATCGLPAPAIQRLQVTFEGRQRFTEADVDAAIAAERDYLAKFTESGHVQLPFDQITVEDRAVKINDMLDAFFDPAHKDHANVRSFKECYIEITGDKRVTGRLEDADVARLRESLGANFRESLASTSWASVLGTSITRRMIADYRAAVDYDAFRQICNTVPVSDFRTQDRVRFGGYGDLPIVAQGAAYTALASPTDEKAQYAVAKRGGTEDITLEMIKNDDVGSIQRIPMKLARAAKRTLSKFVFDFIVNNAAVYDAVAWFHASHNNLLTSALDATQLAAHRLLMMKQAELNSADRLGIPPRKLVVPLDVQETAVNLFNRNTNNDKTFIQSMTMDIVPVWYWTDTNDWATMADPRDIPGIEVGFLDGQEEPQLFVQDNPSVGSMFSNDKLTYKIRHIYSGAVVDYRAGTKAVVP